MWLCCMFINIYSDISVYFCIAEKEIHLKQMSNDERKIYKRIQVIKELQANVDLSTELSEAYDEDTQV